MEKVSKVMRTIGPDLLKLFQEAIPNIVANPKLRSLFFAILTRTLTRGLPQGYVVTSEEWIAYYVDEWQAYCSNNSKRFTGIKFLQALKDALPEGWEMQWTTPDYEENKARTTRIIVPSYVKEAMYIDARDRPSPRYYMYKWNTKVTSRNASKASDLIFEMEREVITQAKHPYQEAMLSYLSSRDIREFKPMDIEGAQQLIETYPIGKKECHLQSLAFILDYPKPSYYPVEGCYRIYAPGLQFLKSDIRKALYPKLIDLDLKSCHTAILSTILDLPRTKELLLNKQDFWVYLTFNIDPLLPIFIYPSIKKAIKKTLYALCFGAGVSTLKSIFIEEMEINTELKPSHILKSWKSFKEIDVIQELSSKTQQWRTQLKQDKEYSDVLGNHYIINSSRDIRRACFNMCSAYELALIYPIYQEAIVESRKNRPQFKVLLHSHDGVSIHIPQNHMKIPIITHLSSVVQQVANVLGVPTYLESKTIDVNTQLVEDVGTLQRALIRRT